MKDLTSTLIRWVAILGIVTVLFWILMFGAVTSPLWITFIVLNIPSALLIFILAKYTNVTYHCSLIIAHTQVFNSLYKLYFKLSFDVVAYFCPGEDLLLINAGYAKLTHDGITLEDYSQNPEVYRYQLYHHVVIENGGLKNMKGKTLLETGCGKGGGLHYLAKTLKPAEAIGVDFSGRCVSYFMIYKLIIDYFR